MGGAPRPRRILLIHGAWHGAWCWKRVLAPLRVLGYEPETIDLPGHSGSTKPPTDLHDDADAVLARLDAVGVPSWSATLRGHGHHRRRYPRRGDWTRLCGPYTSETGQTLMDLLTAPALPDGERPSERVATVRFSDDRSETLLQGDGVTGALY
jgi:hypothetical protein